MKQKVLITGSNGLLGQKLVNLFSSNNSFDVFALSLGEDRNQTADNYSYYNIDITDEFTLKQLLEEIVPNYIINCAAMTNVDQCEQEKEKCDLLNVVAVKTLTTYCEHNNTHLIHISTDFIFDGKNGPYREEDEPNPLNYYGLSKLKSENVIKSSDINYTILRTILVYGLVDNMSRSNIVLFVKQSLENRKEITMVNDQYRMPTLVDDLAQSCYMAIKNKAYGVYHISSCELISIYDMALQIAQVFELDNKYIKPISTVQLNQLAQRPSKTGFDLKKSHAILKTPLVSFKNRLQVFKNQLESYSY